MSATATQTKTKVNAYAAITDRIIAALEEGTVPWQRPWRSVDGHGPTSLTSGKEYRGINTWMLSLTAMTQGYGSIWWGTYRQIGERGGQVRKGEHGTQVVLWKPVDKTREKANGEEEHEHYLVMRLYTVFNSEQADWPDGSKLPHEPQKPPVDWTPVEEAERIQANMPQRPEVRYGSDRAYYSPTLDYVGMPYKGWFDTAARWYATLFHELAHATGHASRLGRDGIEIVDRFGSERYSREELVAEMASAYVVAEAGLEPRIDQSAAYIHNWLAALRNDQKMVVRAASQAQKAADWILDRREKKEES